MFCEPGSLGDAVSTGTPRALLTFGGQDPRWAESLDGLLLGRDEDRRWCEQALVTLGARLAEKPFLHPGLASEGIRPVEWLDGGTRWTQAERAGGHLCLMGSLLGHLVAARILGESGIGVGVGGHDVASLSGHSSGLLAAWLVSRHGSMMSPDSAADALLAFAVMADMAGRTGHVVAPSVVSDVFVAAEHAATPMLSVAGPTEDRLRGLLATSGHGSIEISLQNGWDRFVLVGPPAELGELASELATAANVRVEPIPSSCGYHHSNLAPAADEAVRVLRSAGVELTGDLAVPLMDPRDGTCIDSDDVTQRMTESILVHPVRWADSLAGCIGDVGVVIDAGPSSGTAVLTRAALRGSGVLVVAIGEARGRRELTCVQDRPGPAETWHAYAPRTETGSAHRLATRHRDRTGRSAVVLAGMTPTTVDTAIVAAAANAGHMAELAGGGQVSEGIFELRIDELTTRLAPGHEVVFNTLYLDPYLWGLHLGRDRLVQRARRAGAPICGVTFSAGIPELDEAISLLDELNDLGIWLNAFKPGDIPGVRRVLDIASQTDHQIWLHLEGGLAGGHHSDQDLEDVLFATYAEIRQHDNVTLLVGGGVDTPAGAARLLGGEWALRRCPWHMPVDGVLLGTVAMACAESTASATVKVALAAAPGGTGAVAPGESLGGVTSGRSGLGADIHYLDNHAARVAAMLAEVAGDAEAVAERHEEIAHALSATAKPYFGDLATMRWDEVVERYVELCALGRHGRYEDGAWLDTTHRERFLTLLRRAEQRCVDVDEGTFRSVFEGGADLDDPNKALEVLRDRYPLALTAVLTPSDVARVIEICDGPGKPVPFVVAIDAEVRRRYLADSLWQAHSDLWNADEVLVIPGPQAVAGITDVDEPVADLLDRFDAEVARLLEDSTGDASGPLAAHSGTDVGDRVEPSAVEALLALRSVRHGAAMVRSPLELLDPGGAGWTVDHDGGRCTAELRVGTEVARVAGPGAPTGRVDVTVCWPALPGVPGDGEFTFSLDVEVDHGVVVAVLDEDSLADSEAAVLRMLGVAAAGASASSSRGGSPVGSTVVPDASMTRMWQPIFGALEADGAGDGLLRLVHARHRVTLPGDLAVETGADGSAGLEPGDPRAEVVARGHVPGGRRIHVRGSDTAMVFDDEFLVRDGPGAYGSGKSSSPLGHDRGPFDEEPDSLEEDPATAPTEGLSTDPVDDDDAVWIPTPRHFLARCSVTAPRRPEAFAAVTGDANPIHRSDLVARLGGLPGRIVHGMWTSATAQALIVDEVLRGDGKRLAAWDIEFLGVVAPGAELELTASRVAVCDARRRVEVRVEHDGGVVAMAKADLDPPRTAYVFPGQGIQNVGMGLDALERSPAARGTWNRADRHCRRNLGFSVLEVVRDNPEALVVGSERFRHPAGVLHLTQFTQVAMATLAAAQVEEMRESGVLATGAIVAGHSVGEYNALASAGGVLPLEAVLDIVWARGNAMHRLVPRDADGVSDYRLGVVRPHLAGLRADEAARLVDAVARECGELCQIVNHNLRDRQYAVAGTVAALELLERRLGPGTSEGRSPFLLVPGIDVPFHSRALAGGVGDFRTHLDSALPEEIDPGELIGLYVPNLHPEPFSLRRDYVEAVSAVCDGLACGDILEAWDEHADRPGRLARQLLVELLAWQFASPVRWIETTDAMLGPVETGGLGVQRVVEVGIGTAPTLTNLTRAAVAADSVRGVEVLHLEADRAEVFEETTRDEPVPEPAGSLGASDETDPLGEGDLDEDWDGDAPGPAQRSVPTPRTPAPEHGSTVGPAVDAAAVAEPVVGGATSAGPVSEVADRPVEIADAVSALLAHLTHLRPDQLDDDSIDQLVDGASSRRNQVLMDLGKEFGVGSIDGAHEAPRSVLIERLVPMVRSHHHPGPVLSAAGSAGVGAALGPLGQGAGFLARHVQDTWGLGEGWVRQCELELTLGTRDGVSRRGGELRTLPGDVEAAELIDAALGRAAERLGVELRKPETASVATVDGAELQALRTDVGRALSEAAQVATATLGGPDAAATDSDGLLDVDPADRERLAVLDSEHGPERATAVAPLFDTERVRHLDSAPAWARAQLDHLFHDSVAGRLEASAATGAVGHLRCFTGTDARFDATVQWYRTRAGTAGATATEALFGEVAAGPCPEQRRASSRLSGRTVLVSGASPGSIGEATVAELLAGGATVIMVSHTVSRARRLAVRELFRRHGGPGAGLFFVPANLASFTDIDRIVEWLGSGAEDSPGLPDVVLPFAAAPVAGDVPDTDASTEVELRVLLLGVERLVGRLAEATGGAPGRAELTAVLPMSPNQGGFGGDGSYGNAKAGLEVLEARRLSEFDRWGRHCRIVGAEIGWVRGTGLMGANDDLAPVVEQQLGVRTWTAAEMGAQIAELCAPPDLGGPGSAPTTEPPDGRSTTGTGPVQTRVDLTGGLSEAARSGVLARLLRHGLPTGPAPIGGDPGLDGDHDSRGGPAAARDERAERDLAALVTPNLSEPLGAGDWPATPDVAADDMVVICGTGEIGPWGAATTRASVERHGGPDAAGIVELALACGLLRWDVGGSGGGYVDAGSGEPVPEDELPERYRDDVMERCGIRRTGSGTYDQDVEVFLDRPVTLGLDDREAAEAFAGVASGTVVRRDGDRWALTLPQGAPLRLRRSAELPRDVTAPIPDGMTPASFGVPVEMTGSIDPVAAWNLAVTAEAFLDAGTDVEEILGVVHPARVGNSQGTGMGGTTSLRGLNLDPVHGTAHPNDLLQEALGNVPSAHVMQSLVGGYGPMVHPVAACATAAVSLEVAVDMVHLDKADVVVAGGFDDLSREGIIGFADMSATADSALMAQAGFEPSEMSRPGDRDRAGFLESQGGGTMIVCRGSVARRLGLPVRAVVGLARSYSDGVQNSIPAPGLGAVAVAMGGRDSPLARSLADLGLGADDIAVVSKHDTSTRANDPNEAAIHDELCRLLGRSDGNPLRVVSQKSITGHAKGGSAAWQVAGICDVFESGIVPGNPNLDCVDPQVQAGALVPDDRALHMGTAPRAALVTSLGFGHVSAVVLLVHKDAFVAALPDGERSGYLATAERRRSLAAHRRRWRSYGGVPAYRRPRGRRLGDGDDESQRRTELDVLADPRARLDSSGHLATGPTVGGPT